MNFDTVTFIRNPTHSMVCFHFDEPEKHIALVLLPSYDPKKIVNELRETAYVIEKEIQES